MKLSGLTKMVKRHDWPGGWVPDYGTGPEPLKKKGGETV